MSVLLLLFVALLFSCGKEKETPDRSFSGIIQGQPFSWTDGQQGMESHAAWGFGNDCSAIGILVYQQSGFEKAGSNEQLYFAISGCVDLENNPSAQSTTMIKTGIFPYGPVIYESGVVQVVYQDSTGTSWRSYSGSANQTGHSFEISRVEDSHDSKALFVVSGQFSCVLYNNLGDSILIENAVFSSFMGISSSFK